MHSEIELKIRDEYLAHLNELEEKCKFEEFADIGELRRRIEISYCFFQQFSSP
jgi:hypothetical protein